MNDRLRYLYDSYIDKTATLVEQQELAKLISETSSMEQVREWIGAEMETTETEYLITTQQAEEVFRRMMLSRSENKYESTSVRRGRLLTPVWLRYAAAILIFLTAGVYVYTKTRFANVSVVAATKSENIRVVPGGNRAVLTLADGSTILLDSAANGNLASQGNTKVVKLSNGEIVYQVTGKDNRPVGLNTMSTPRGGLYQLRLPDGTQVWLNAASSITYPTYFSGTERRVEVTGELYFEVAKNPKMPFRVHISNAGGRQSSQELEVIGTHFNVNSYTDEPASTITLLEGAVKIDNKVLKPGEAYSEGKISKVNTEEAVAWMNGYFRFNQADIKTVMRQISRWYNVEVNYEGEIPDRKFGGEVLRTSELSDVLKGLELNGIHFRMSDRSLIVIP